MKHITFYFDVVSPYAYLAFEQLPAHLEGISCSVTYKPVLFAGLLNHHGQLGPAEVVPKRDWTYRHVQWLAQTLNIPLQMPPSHPFNPLGLLRLALAVHPSVPGAVNRHVCESVLRHVWCGGQEATATQRFDELTTQLGPVGDWQSDSMKTILKSNTSLAISQGVFGVPSVVVDDKVFWGADALPMLRSYLLGDAWFAGSGWQDVAGVSVGASRTRAE